MNKVEIRQAIASAAVTWIRWKRTRQTKLGIVALGNKREFQNSMDDLVSVFLFLEPHQMGVSKIWREALNCADMWLSTGRVTTRAMLRLINSFHISL